MKSVETVTERQTHSLWEKESFLGDCHLIVIGGGIVGLSSAFIYKKQFPDHRVMVVDKGMMPEGASTRNAGFACVGSIGEHVADMNRETRENIGRRIVRRYEGLQLLKATLGEEAIGYDPCGGHDFFVDRESYEATVEHLDEFNRWMEELLGEREVYSPRSLNGFDVIHNRLEGSLRPGRMMQRLVDLVSREGVEIRWNTPVESVDEGGTVRVKWGIRWKAERVLVACNGFTRRLLPETSVVPARGYVLVTDPQEELAWRGIFHHDRGYIYFRNVDDRLLIGGARNLAIEEEESDRFGVNPVIRDHLVDFVTRHLLPDRDWKIDHEWSGIMGFTPTKTPELKKAGGTLFVAAGLSGMGIAIGMEIGRQAADLLKGDIAGEPGQA